MTYFEPEETMWLTHWWWNFTNEFVIGPRRLPELAKVGGHIILVSDLYTRQQAPAHSRATVMYASGDRRPLHAPRLMLTRFVLAITASTTRMLTPIEWSRPTERHLIVQKFGLRVQVSTAERQKEPIKVGQSVSLIGIPGNFDDCGMLVEDEHSP